MKQLGMAAVLVLATATLGGACGGKQGDGAATPAPADPATTPITGHLTSPGAGALAELESLRVQACACRDPGCAADVQLAFANFMEQHADTVGTERQAEEAGRIAEAMMVCLGQAAAEPEPWAGLDDGLAECDAYVAAVERFIECDKVPQASRDATRQGLDGMKAAWGDSSTMPPEARTAANDSCRQATDALRQGAEAMGCPL